MLTRATDVRGVIVYGILLVDASGACSGASSLLQKAMKICTLSLGAERCFIATPSSLATQSRSVKYGILKASAAVHRRSGSALSISLIAS